jgi:hypothetical protein
MHEFPAFLPSPYSWAGVFVKKKVGFLNMSSAHGGAPKKNDVRWSVAYESPPGRSNDRGKLWQR